MTQTALLIETTAAILAGPIAGVVLSHRPRPAVPPQTADRGRRWWMLALKVAGGALAFTALCVAANTLAGLGRPTTPLTVAPHVTLGTAFLAACAVGAACGARFDDPLDAAACSLVLAACASFGIFVAGPPLAGAPPAVVDAALTLSPVSATASAANIDIFRGELLYRLSPLAHTHLVYPAWPTATLVYLVIALACLATAARISEVKGLSGRNDGLCPKG